MKPYEIKSALWARNIKLSEVASGLGVSRPVVSQVVSRQKKSARVEQAIAAAIGRPVEEVFPKEAA